MCVTLLEYRFQDESQMWKQNSSDTAMISDDKSFQSVMAIQLHIEFNPQ